MKKHLSSILIVMLLTLGHHCAQAAMLAEVTINGHTLTTKELQMLESQLGVKIRPGDYWTNMKSICGSNLNSVKSSCPSGSSVSQRRTVGERNGRAGNLEEAVASN